MAILACHNSSDPVHLLVQLYCKHINMTRVKDRSKQKRVQASRFSQGLRPVDYDRQRLDHWERHAGLREREEGAEGERERGRKGGRGEGGEAPGLMGS